MIRLQSIVVAVGACVLLVGASNPAQAAKGEKQPGPPTVCARTGATQFVAGSERTCVQAGAQGNAQCIARLANWANNGPPQAAVNEAAGKCKNVQTCNTFQCPVQGEVCKGTSVAANGMAAQKGGPFAGSPACANTPNTPDECVITAPFMCDCKCQAP